MSRAGLCACAASAALATAALAPGAAVAAAAGGPIQAACFATRGGCRIQVAPFQIDIAPGQHLERYEVRVGGVRVYDFRTDVSNPPSFSYWATMPERGFAARCARSYVVSAAAQDSGDRALQALGATAEIECPVAVAEPGAGLAGAAAAAALAGVRSRAGRVAAPGRR